MFRVECNSRTPVILQNEVMFRISACHGRFGLIQFFCFDFCFTSFFLRSFKKTQETTSMGFALLNERIQKSRLLLLCVCRCRSTINSLWHDKSFFEFSSDLWPSANDFFLSFTCLLLFKKKENSDGNGQRNTTEFQRFVWR